MGDLMHYKKITAHTYCLVSRLIAFLLFVSIVPCLFQVIIIQFIVHFRYRLQLLSSNLTQNGEDDEGMLGFLQVDIKKEVERAAKMVIYTSIGMLF